MTHAAANDAGTGDRGDDVTVGQGERDATGAVVSRIGRLTRRLHDNLRALGYDRLIEDAVQAMPDARDRLNYVSTMTEQAATRVINATEVADPVIRTLAYDAARLHDRWQQVGVADLNGNLAELAACTRAYLRDIPVRTDAIGKQLLEIVLAQEFQDLTGQVIRRLTDVLQQFEAEALQLLVEHVPPRSIQEDADGLLNGPQISPDGKPDVLASQDRVDQLLESLGF